MSESPGDNGGMDDALQREIDEALGGRSIEDLLDEAAPAPQALDQAGEIGPGQVRKGTVVMADSQAVLVELGGKDQGMVPAEQFDEPPAVGEQIELSVVRYDGDEDLWVLSRRGAIQRATWEDLSVGQLVEAFVEGSNKGGLEVRFGSINAFMPISQISMYRVEDPAEFVGQKLRCQVVELDRGRKRVIVSGRALMEVEAEQKREQLMAELAEGDVREGIVRQVMPYGAFVDLGGVDGLVHVSQMSYARVKDPADVVQPGQRIKVQVLKIDQEAGRIALGMKQIAPDPWEGVEGKYPPGTLVTGPITSLQDFGAFCQIEEGLEALIPISEITWMRRLNHPSQILQAGETVQAQVLNVDAERRRMSLSIKQAQADPWAGASGHYPAGSIQAGRVTKIADFGAFVELSPGVEGLLHVSEMSDKHVGNPGEVVQVDQTVRVRVVEVSEADRRMSLSLKGVGPAGESPADGASAEEKPAGARKRPLRGGLD